MLEIPGFKSLRKILWKNLDPGMIVIGGVKVNNGLPLELVNYPALTVISLFHRYLIQREKENVIQKKGIILPEGIQLLSTPYINKDYLIKDTYNSFEVKIPNSNPPSMFSHLEEKITLADILTGKLKDKFRLPEDVDVMLHLVVDYSYSMNTMDKLDLVIAAVNLFYTHISECMLNVKLQLYVFSEVCIPAKFPLSGKEIERKGTHYGSFMKKVLPHRNLDIINKVILFTDGEPTDKTDAILTGNKMKNLKVDYTQIVFDTMD